jgi:catechol 2,3-dioxygenase-like lactoylglutathione lyase family enzyme
MNSRISMITLDVCELPRAVRFYEEGLGFRVWNRLLSWRFLR